MATGPTLTRNAVGASWGGDTQDIEPGMTVQLITGDPSRRAASVVTDVDSAGTLYLVPTPGQRSGGIRLVPGAGWMFEHSAPIYAYAVGGPVTVTTVVETGAQC